MKAELIEYLKQNVRGKFILEIKIWRVLDKNYPNNLKYSLVFIEDKTGRMVLMDNHYPKNPHVHIDNAESDYKFVDLEQLLQDFRNLVFEHFGEKI